MLVLVLVVAFLAVSRPAGRPAADDAAATPGAASPGGPTTPGPDATEPPDDLVQGDVWLTGISLDARTLATRDGALHDVVVTGQDIRTGGSGLVARVLDIEATVPFELVAGQIGGDVTVGPVPGHPDRAAVQRTFEAFGRAVDVEATGTVLVRDGLLVIEPRTIDLGGPRFLSELLGTLAREAVTIEHAIEGLPPGLVLLDVAVQGDGFRATLAGTDVRIEP